MKKTSKTKNTTHTNSQTSKPFFNKSGEGTFFSNSKEVELPFFSPSNFQTKLTIGEPGDKYEQEADTMAEKVVQKLDVTKSTSIVQNKCDDCKQEEKLQKVEDKEMEISKKPIFGSDERINNKLIQGKGMNEVNRTIETQLQNSKRSGQPLDDRTRQNMEKSFGADFTNVNVHTDNNAIQMNQKLGAQAFTNGNDIYFNSGKYNPNTKIGNKLLAHELTHVLQQGNNGNKNSRAKIPTIQRVVELRPPGRGEASAFGRAQEFMDRLNAISNALEFRLDGRVLRYNVINEPSQTHFDRQLRAFIDRAEVVPMRLITGAGYVGGGPLLVDSLQLGYVDLDDLLASDDLGFQSNIIHLLTERFAVRDYNRRLGTAGVGAQWARVHPMGLRAEAQFFQDVFNDPSIRFSWDRTAGNDNYLAVFRSTTEGFRVLLQIRGGRRERRGTQISIRTRDGRTLTTDAFQAERARAVAPPAAP